MKGLHPVQEIDGAGGLPRRDNVARRGTLWHHAERAEARSHDRRNHGPVRAGGAGEPTRRPADRRDDPTPFTLICRTPRRLPAWPTARLTGPLGLGRTDSVALCGSADSA
jgi:hypothetical protein